MPPTVSAPAVTQGGRVGFAVAGLAAFLSLGSAPAAESIREVSAASGRPPLDAGCARNRLCGGVTRPCARFSLVPRSDRGVDAEKKTIGPPPRGALPATHQPRPAPRRRLVETPGLYDGIKDLRPSGPQPFSYPDKNIYSAKLHSLL